MRIAQMEAEAILKAMLARVESIEPTGPAKIRLKQHHPGSGQPAAAPDRYLGGFAYVGRTGAVAT